MSKGDGNLAVNSKAKAEQIRTIDKSRLVRLIGDLTPQEMAEIEQAISYHLDCPLVKTQSSESRVCILLLPPKVSYQS